MSQRRAAAASGRPSGTDGSDFRHRMVVDSRYTKVAEGKSRLGALFAAQLASQVIGSFWFFSYALHVKELKSFAILSVATGYLSLLIGELGRRRSRVTLLRFYNSISAASIAFSVVCMIKSGLLFKVTQDYNLSVLTNFELLEAVRVIFGIMLQIFIILTTFTLVQNMSPKRSS